MKEIFKRISEITRQGTTVLIAEQNVRLALQIAHRAAVMAGWCSRVTRAPCLRTAESARSISGAISGVNSSPMVHSTLTFAEAWLWHAKETGRRRVGKRDRAGGA